MKKFINKKVFLNELPRLMYYSVDKIDWKNCIGKSVRFVYGDIEDTFEIISHNIETQKVGIKYNNKMYYLCPNSIIHGKLGQLFKTKRFTYLYNIDDTIIDNNRNLKITDRYKNSKNVRWYKYTCNICGWTGGEQSEYELEKGVNCSCCSNRVVVKGINDITTTARWMIPYFQGKDIEASKYTRCSNEKIVPICPDCNTVYNKELKINEIYFNHGFSCPICKDGYSYPEKFFYSFLKQLDIYFIIQFSSKNASWTKKYRYDYYIPCINYIIEIHGKQHYENTKIGNIGRSLQEEINNDIEKEKLALLNGYNYISIDCRKSDKNWISNSIIESGILNLLKRKASEIDWDECDKFATSNRCKEVCKLKSENPKLSAKDISKLTQISTSIVCDYLHKGTQFGWCYYSRNQRKRIRMLKDGTEIGIFDYVKDITKLEQYKDFCETTIQNVCRGHINSYKGYTFDYI